MPCSRPCVLTHLHLALWRWAATSVACRAVGGGIPDLPSRAVLTPNGSAPKLRPDTGQRNGTSVRARQPRAHKRTAPLEAGPVSFKRLLGGITGPIRRQISEDANELDCTLGIVHSVVARDALMSAVRGGIASLTETPQPGCDFGTEMGIF